MSQRSHDLMECGVPGIRGSYVVTRDFLKNGNLEMLLLSIACCLSVGCAVNGFPKVSMPVRPDPERLQIDREWKLSSLGFEAAILDIKRGRIVGAFPGGYSEQSGSFCNAPRGAEMTQSEGRQVIAGRDGEFASIFYETLSELGYAVVGDPRIVFGREDELNKAKYLVAARIVDMKANICNVASLMDGRSFGTQNGEIFLEVEWSVYSPLQRAVVLTVASSGYQKTLAERRDGFYLIFADAFARATRNFAASRDLLALVNETGGRDSTPSFAHAIGLRKVAAISNFQGSYGSLLDSVVTIRAGRGHGSGFLVSTDGYILTNAHVVAATDEVAVVFEAGFELVGHVVRSNKVGDVALVKVELGRAVPLPLQLAKPRVGDEVVAIGTPLDLVFEKTVTRGIVSSLRFLEDYQMEMIQSDVVIQPGNSGGPLLDKNGSVIGISTLGIHGGVGLNFFIPIGVALETLAIEVE